MLKLCIESQRLQCIIVPPLSRRAASCSLGNNSNNNGGMMVGCSAGIFTRTERKCWLSSGRRKKPSKVFSRSVIQRLQTIKFGHLELKMELKLVSAGSVFNILKS